MSMDDKVKKIQALIDSGKGISVLQACEKVGVSQGYFYHKRKALSGASKKKKRKPKAVSIAYAAPSEGRPGNGSVVALVGSPGEIGKALAGLGFGGLA